MSKKIIIYDSPMCCTSGLCGSNQDQTVIQFNAVLEKLKKDGYEIERYVISQSPEKFKEDPKILELIQQRSLKVLPITKINGTIVKTEKYPTLEEIENEAAETGPASGSKVGDQTGGCCAGGGACGTDCIPSDDADNNLHAKGGCCCS